jgi:hypothetical protein
MRQTRDGKDEIVAEPGSDTAAILRYSKNYFDTRLPKYVPQAIAVDLHALDLVTPLDDPDK